MSQIAVRITTLPGEGTVTSVTGGNNITITGTPTVAPIVNVSGTVNHDVLLGNVTGSINSLTNGTTGQVLTAQTGADPIWASLPGGGTVTSVTAGTGINITGTPTIAPIVNLTVPVTVPLGGTGQITNTNHGVLLGQGASAIIATAVGATNTVLLGNTGADPSFGTVPNAALANSSVTLSNGNNITVTGSPLSLGGTASFNLTGTTNHAVQVGNATGSLTSLAVGATNTVLLGNSGADPSFGTVPNAALANSSVTLSSGNNITVTGGGPLALGGTASFNVTGTTNNSLLIGNATGSISSLGVATNGQLPIGSTGTTPVLATLTAGSGITITNGAGSINIAASGSGGVTSLAGTANQVTASASTGAVTLSVPSTFISPGSIASTSTITAATGLTVTAGGAAISGTSNINTFNVSSAGIATNTGQPCFLAWPSANLVNVTGDATVYTLAFNSTTTNQSASYNTGTYTFTAPVTGSYMFGQTIYTTGYAAQTIYIVRAVATSGTYEMGAFNPTPIVAGNGIIVHSSSTIISMANGDTINFYLYIATATKAITIGGGVNGTLSRIWGYLVC